MKTTSALPPAGLDHVIPPGTARLVRAGRDVTVVAWGHGLQRAVAAAERLAGDGISVEIIDPRWLDRASFDRDAVLASVASHRRAGHRRGRHAQLLDGQPDPRLPAARSVRVPADGSAPRHRRGCLLAGLQAARDVRPPARREHRRCHRARRPKRVEGVDHEHDDQPAGAEPRRRGHRRHGHSPGSARSATRSPRARSWPSSRPRRPPWSSRRRSPAGSPRSSSPSGAEVPVGETTLALIEHD